VRTLTQKQQGELNFWIDHLHGGCERELGKPFLVQWSAGARGRLARFERYIPEMSAHAGAVWVDVGTGPYSVLMQAPRDVTKVMIDPLMKHYFRYELISLADAPPQSVFLEGVGEDLPLVDGIADLVICTNTLDHVDDPWVTVRELARILKIGGALALEVDTCGMTDYMHPHAMAPDAIDEHFASADLAKVFGCIPEDQGQRRPGALLYHAFYRRTMGKRGEIPMSEIRAAIRPTLVREGVHGFNIVRLWDPEDGEGYYALLQSDGAFIYDKVAAGGYRVLFRGRTITDVQEQIETHMRATASSDRDAWPDGSSHSVEP
jgi:ubiquinone/menaquinone biosynthesis C-methylase UbiE